MEAGKCKKCGTMNFPRRLICRSCGQHEFDIVRLTGNGKLATFTIIRTAPEGFGDFAPYAVGIVELEEGIRVLSQITDCNPETLKAGDPLVAKFRRMNEEGKTGMIMYSFKFVPDNGI
jgi:uncharacterized OB-fold protein